MARRPYRKSKSPFAPRPPGRPPERLAAWSRAVQRDFGWRWTGAVGWGRVAPQGYPGGEGLGKDALEGSWVFTAEPPSDKGFRKCKAFS
jgi:hypothetical protein